MVEEAAVLRHIGTPVRAAARATASSASSCRIDRTPTGPSMTGAGKRVPRMSVLRSRTLTSPSIRGRICQASNARRFAVMLRPSPAPPAA